MKTIKEDEQEERDDDLSEFRESEIEPKQNPMLSKKVYSYRKQITLLKTKKTSLKTKIQATKM